MLNFKSKIVVALLLAASASMAQAAMYSVQGEFTEPMTIMGGTVGNTIFSGTFDWDGTSLSNFKGLMNSSMASMTQNLNLMYNPVAAAVSGSTVTATAFLVNTNNVFWGGGYKTGDTKKYGGIKNGVSDGKVANENAYFTFSFDSTTMAGITSSMVYGDCTAAGLMPAGGSTCMTGRAKDSNGIPGAGTMGATPLSLAVTAVPIPAAVWLFGSALVGLLGVNRRKQVLPA
jgi:hypothetical protein